MTDIRENCGQDQCDFVSLFPFGITRAFITINIFC